MRRTLVTAGVVALFAACGFPDVTFTEGDDGGPDAAKGPDGAMTVDAPPDRALDGEASAGDSATEASGEEAGDSSMAGDSGGGGDAAGESGLEAASDSPADQGTDAPVDAPNDVREAGADAPAVCDVDKDTYLAKGGTCGGNDCCDTDGLAHPGQASFFTAQDACGSFDYNCNGALDLEYPVNLKCGGTGLTGCTGGSAFLGNPSCGTQALYGTCVPNGALACQAGNEIMVTQGCN